MGMGKIYKNNQSGATAIMFAMFFIIVISLITIGFATLARRDQRSTLDKTISYQAQYATESIVNVLQQKADSGSLTTKSACADLNSNGIPTKVGDVDVTCVGWDVAPRELAFDLDPYKTKSFVNSGSQGFTEITWSAEDGTTNTAETCSGKICATTIPFIKVTSVTTADINNELGSMRVAYLVPSNSVGAPPTSVNTSTENGKDFFVGCASGICTARISHAGGAGPRAYFFQPIGGKKAKIIFKEFNAGFATVQTIPGVMAKVDVNVKQPDQNINKRLITYISLQPDTFQPFAGTVADSLCKDYKTDGSQGGGACAGGVPNAD
jgi:hypothetical protein